MMTSKSVLMVVGVLFALMGLWALLVLYAAFPEFGFTANVWVALIQVVVGAYAVYVSMMEK